MAAIRDKMRPKWASTGALEAKPEAEIWRRPATVTWRRQLPIRWSTWSHFSQFRNYLRFCKSTSGLTMTTFCTRFSDYSRYDDISDLSGHFSKYIRFFNSTSGPNNWPKKRNASCVVWPAPAFIAHRYQLGEFLCDFAPFESKTMAKTTFGSSFGNRFGLVAHSFLTRSISSHLPAIQRPYWPEHGKNERSGDTSGQMGNRNVVATRFFDSATPTSYSTPIHYGVYLAPSPSYHPGILTTLIKIYWG